MSHTDLESAEREMFRESQSDGHGAFGGTGRKSLLLM